MSMDLDGLPPNPIDLFSRWYDHAKGSGDLPDAMALATSTRDGRPSNRFVLLKGADDRGFVFFSNYGSRKGGELAKNPRAAAAIFWQDPRRQVRIEGVVERLTAEESDAYFKTRDRLSQIGAVVSPQSCVLSDRAELDDAVDRLRREREGEDISRPAHWGGYRIVPEAVEFWIGRESRLHDRFRYRRDGEGWLVERLAP